MIERSGQTTHSVSDLAALIAGRIREAFPTDMWVRGEIHNLTRARSGHVYFTLVDSDADGEIEPPPRPALGRAGFTNTGNGGPNGAAAQLKVMLHNRDRTRVNRLLQRSGGAVRMVDGTEVRIRVKVDFYEARGELQLRMASIDPAFTLGQMAVARAELIARLKADGVFDANRARPMPLAPLRIGLITSVGSAAEADVLHELLGSGYAFDIEVADVRVQGAEAPDLVARAVADLGREDLDTIVVARGGGATTDLAAFDSELVARAVAACPLPVVCGVGHEIDRSVTDEVAHYSAKTPTAAAQYVVGLVSDAEARAEAAFAALGVAAHRRLHLAATHLDRCRERARAAAVAATRSERQRVDSLELRFGPAVRRRLALGADQVEQLESRIERGARALLANRSAAIDLIAARVAVADPARALARGWSITRLPDGTIVRSINDVSEGTTVETALADGTVTSTVERTQGP